VACVVTKVLILKADQQLTGAACMCDQQQQQHFSSSKSLVDNSKWQQGWETQAGCLSNLIMMMPADFLVGCYDNRA